MSYNVIKFSIYDVTYNEAHKKDLAPTRGAKSLKKAQYPHYGYEPRTHKKITSPRSTSTSDSKGVCHE